LVAVPSIIAVRGANRVVRSVPPLTNRSLFGRDLHICGYCGVKYPADKLTRDHIIPVSRNGRDVWNNCVTACKRCNNKKDDRLPEECGMQLLYVPYVPDRNEALLLQNRNILSEQMAFLNDYLPRHSRLRLS
jgi:5-methylcytosine-specific restriction endonuclease McrA